MPERLPEICTMRDHADPGIFFLGKHAYTRCDPTACIPRMKAVPQILNVAHNGGLWHGNLPKMISDMFPGYTVSILSVSLTCVFGLIKRYACNHGTVCSLFKRGDSYLKNRPYLSATLIKRD
jgi:hypothetical protein